MDLTGRLRRLLRLGSSAPRGRRPSAPPASSNWEARGDAADPEPDRDELEEFLRADAEGAPVDTRFRRELRERLWKRLRSSLSPGGRGEQAARPESEDRDVARREGRD